LSAFEIGFDNTCVVVIGWIEPSFEVVSADCPDGRALASVLSALDNGGIARRRSQASLQARSATVLAGLRLLDEVCCGVAFLGADTRVPRESRIAKRVGFFCDDQRSQGAPSVQASSAALCDVAIFFWG